MLVRVDFWVVSGLKVVQSQFDNLLLISTLLQPMAGPTLGSLGT